MIRDKLVDTLTKYGDYIVAQGGDREYLDKLGEELNNLIIIMKVYYTEYYLTLGCAETLRLSSAEQIVDKGLQAGMSHKKYYKEIYKDVKVRVETFAELHGKSEVIQKALDYK